MARLKRFAIAVLAAATVTVGSFGIVPTASAAVAKSCEEKAALAMVYWAAGAGYYALGNYVQAAYYFGKAEGLTAFGC